MREGSITVRLQGGGGGGGGGGVAAAATKLTYLHTQRAILRASS